MAAESPGQDSDFSTQKKVDEAWKNAVKGPQEGPEETPAADSSFAFFISTIGMQALMALGEIANPSTGEKKAERRKARASDGRQSGEGLATQEDGASGERLSRALVPARIAGYAQ